MLSHVTLLRDENPLGTIGLDDAAPESSLLAGF